MGSRVRSFCRVVKMFPSLSKQKDAEEITNLLRTDITVIWKYILICWNNENSILQRFSSKRWESLSELRNLCFLVIILNSRSYCARSINTHVYMIILEFCIYRIYILFIFPTIPVIFWFIEYINCIRLGVTVILGIFFTTSCRFQTVHI